MKLSSTSFNQFPAQSGDWELLVETELKRPGAAKSLTWHTDEGFPIKAYHNAYLNSEVVELAHGISELVKKDPNAEFYNCQRFRGIDTESLSKKLQTALNGGVNGLIIYTDFNAHQLSVAFDQVVSEVLWIELHGYHPLELAQSFSARLKSVSVDTSKQFGCISCSPLKHVSENGYWWNSNSEDFDKLKNHLNYMGSEFPAMKAIVIDAGLVHNAGGTITQQIAYALSQGNEYLEWAKASGLDLATTANQLQFHFAFGPNFLLETVKIRVFKWLWNLVLKEHGIAGQVCFVSSSTGTLNTGVYDSHNNLLRSTTETMSALFSGSDAHRVLPFDSAYKESSDFSERISRNITNLLLEESFLGKVENVSNGSYAFDNLQYLLCQNSWELFQTWEKEGGYLACFEEGIIQTTIKESANALRAKFDANEIVVLGVNKYPNKGEKKKQEWSGYAKGLKSDMSIQPFRLAQEEENERLNQE